MPLLLFHQQALNNHPCGNGFAVGFTGVGQWSGCCSCLQALPTLLAVTSIWLLSLIQPNISIPWATHYFINCRFNSCSSPVIIVLQWYRIFHHGIKFLALVGVVKKICTEVIGDGEWMDLKWNRNGWGRVSRAMHCNIGDELSSVISCERRCKQSSHMWFFKPILEISWA